MASRSEPAPIAQGRRGGLGRARGGRCAAAPRGRAGRQAHRHDLVALRRRQLRHLPALRGRVQPGEPDVEVKATSFGPNEITPKFLAALAAGAPPDIFHAPGYVPRDFAQNKVIAPLDDLVKLDPTTLKNFDAITIYDGRRYGVPVNGGLGCMLYNLELMQKAGLDPKRPPDTWDELVAAATR